jgi:hypothetical protein
MPEKNQADEREILRTILDGLDQLDQEARCRILKTAQTFFGLDVQRPMNGPHAEFPGTSSIPQAEREPQFSDRTTLSPKAFLLQKQPLTDVERVTCLAYYLTHYRDTPYFKTIDISKLNTEAAQLKLSNAAYAISNAMRAGLIAPADKGNKQISAFGERLVDALPDREAVKEVMVSLRNRRSRRKSKSRNDNHAGTTAENSHDA